MNKDTSLEETTFAIPYAGEDDDTTITLPSTLSSEEDFPGSHELRFKTYTKAWSKCLNRIQTIVHQLLEPHAEAVARQVQDNGAVPGLPHPELPVLLISNPVFGTSFLNDVCNRIDAPSAHLYPSNCTNLMSAMRSLVSGLAQDIGDVHQAKQKSSTSLANYDIRYLSAWYKEYISTQEGKPTLLVILHNFEEFDPVVMQDLFYICSRHLSELPLSFILSMSTPLPTYLHIVYPRATLANLRIRDVTIPSGLLVLNEILLKTFFSIDFEPDIILGPTALQHISDFFSRHNRTLDSLITNIQLVFMKHVSLEPLTSLMWSTPAWTNPTQGPTPAFLEATLVKILSVDGRTLDAHEGSTIAEKIRGQIEASRTAVYKHSKEIRLAFNLTRLVQLFLVGEGYQGLNWNLETDLCDIFIRFLGNNAERDLKQLQVIVRKLQMGQLRRLLPQIRNFFESADSEGHEDVFAQIPNVLDLIVDGFEEEGMSPERSAFIAKEVAEWLDSMIRSMLHRLESIPLWELWYTGLTPFPSELINPSIRASILSGLLRPLEFTSGQPEELVDVDESLWKLPDTTILCRRYLDSGKMINVYDWFESFQAVLENQRAELKKAAASKRGRGQQQRSPKKRASVSPKKQSAKGKGKQRQGVDDDVEEDEEKWKLEVQARFIRALHELDYLGFIKHTKRRADHVLRTVFDINE